MGASSELLPSLTFRWAEGGELFRLGGRSMFFSPARQSLVELNESAASLVAGMRGGVSAEDVVAAFSSGQDRQEAAHAAADWLAGACENGILTAELPPEAAFEARCGISIGGYALDLAFDDPALCESCLPAYAALPSHHGEAARIAVFRFGSVIALLPDGMPPQFVAPERLATRFRHAILTSILRQTAYVALHAACLTGPEGAILLCGSPGTGKSTLTLALLQRGWGYAGDDIASADATGKVRGLPLPLTLKQGSWPIAGDWVDLAPLPVHHREDGALLKYWPVAPVAPEWRPVRAVIRLAREETRQVAFEPWEPVAALQTLFGEAYSVSGRSSADTVRGMVDLIAGAECLDLSYGEAVDAAGALSERYGVPA